MYGSYTDWICLPADGLVPVPDGLDAAEAVSLVLNYVTAYQLLHRAARVAPGERVLVQGAAGGVGTAILQLGRLVGLEVFGTASAKDLAAVASLGATPIDRRREDFVAVLRARGGADAVLDGIGGTTALCSLRALGRPGGSSCSGITPRGVGTADDGRRRRLLCRWGGHVCVGSAGPGSSCRDLPDREGDAPPLRLVPPGPRASLRSSGGWEIRLLIARRLPLAQAAQAHQMLGAGGVTGKLVLITTSAP